MLLGAEYQADRRVLTSGAVTVGVIGLLTVAGLSIDHGPANTAAVSPAARASMPNPPQTVAATTAALLPPTLATPPTTTVPPAPAIPVTVAKADPGAAHIERASIPDGPLGIPGIALEAYRRAADRLGGEQPGCQLSWSLLAGIGQVESQQGAGRFDVRGNTIGRILGPRLDGSLPGTAVITDTDAGRFDGDTEFDRAVGPVQFIPSTWAGLGRDGNDDGLADPNNIYDGALAAATLLCNRGGSMADPAARTRAVLAYNNSLAYVANVNAWAHAYEVQAYPLPADLPPIHQPTPTIEPPAAPEHCPENWEGTPTAVPEPEKPGDPAPPIPGCTPPPGPPPQDPPPEGAPDAFLLPPHGIPPAAPPPVFPPAPPPVLAPFELPQFELPCLPPFCVPPPA